LAINRSRTCPSGYRVESLARRGKNLEMTDTSKTPDIVQLIAQQQGITRALELYPDSVKAGAERGLKPVTLPRGTPPRIHPSNVFVPVRSKT
jgi:hypothetical protein